MPVHPQCQAVIEAAAAAEGGTVFDARDAVEARRRYDASTPLFAPDTPPLEAVLDRAIPGPAGEIPLRLYRPRGAPGATGFPVLVYFHGGGWVFGNLDSHDAICRILADEAASLVLAVDYRLAPEHKFPAALEDCLAAVRWVAENAGEIDGDGRRLAIGGDSAGGNLAAAVAQTLRDAGGPALCLQLLIYPAVDFTADNESLRTNARGYLLTRDAIEWTKSQYLNGADEERDPRASPAFGDLAGLPPALVMTAEYDPLRDEGQAYAEAMRAAGVRVEHIDYPGMVHGFVRMGKVIDRADEALADAAVALRTAFAA